MGRAKQRNESSASRNPNSPIRINALSKLQKRKSPPLRENGVLFAHGPDWGPWLATQQAPRHLNSKDCGRVLLYPIAAPLMEANDSLLAHTADVDSTRIDRTRVKQEY